MAKAALFYVYLNGVIFLPAHNNAHVGLVEELEADDNIRVVIINSPVPVAPGSPLSASRAVAGLSAAWPLPGRWRRERLCGSVWPSSPHPPAGRLALRAVVVNQTLRDQLPGDGGVALAPFLGKPAPVPRLQSARIHRFGPGVSGSLRRECEPATMWLVSWPAMIGRCACRS